MKFQCHLLQLGKLGPWNFQKIMVLVVISDVENDAVERRMTVKSRVPDRRGRSFHPPPIGTRPLIHVEPFGRPQVSSLFS